MNKVFVLDRHGGPLMPTHPARARRLLAKGDAVVHKRMPFTIGLKYRDSGEVQPVRLKLDPGSKTTGIAILREDDNRANVLHLAELHHKRGIKRRVEARRNFRRRRRGANLRHREPRFLNRGRKPYWLPPSLIARVAQTESWVRRYRRLIPVSKLSVELARFDTRKLQEPEVAGVEYQQGELFGYELREYLLEKWGRKCAYCGMRNVPFEVEHIVPKSRGGSNRAGNLTLACHECNQRKGNRTAQEFGHPGVQVEASRPLRDAAAMNATRAELHRRLVATGLPVETGTGGRTKFNRSRLGFPKTYALDAVCVGASTGTCISGLDTADVFVIRAAGRGRYRRAILDSFGFPRAYSMRQKAIAGFRTGDLVRAFVTRGKRAGIHEGFAVIRKVGYFALTMGGERIVSGVSAERCTLLHRFDGYTYGREEVRVA